MVAGRLVKNPARVPVSLQRADPATGTATGSAGPRVAVARIGEMGTMPKIEETGTYKDGDGNRFFFREGHPISEEQKSDLTLESSGLPQTDEEKRREKRAADQAKARERRAEDAAPENRAEGPAPENRAGVARQRA